MQLSIVRPSEHQRLLALCAEVALSEEPLQEKELAHATLYWRLLAGNIIGEHYVCEGGCEAQMPASGILTNDPGQTDKAAMAHLQLGLAAACRECERRHFVISEALSYHSELLRCAAAKNPMGATAAARRRCALIASLKED